MPRRAADPIAIFRRKEPLHRRLAEAGGLTDEAAPSPPAAQPPGFDGEQRGEPGIHGVPRARRFDVVATVHTDGIDGDGVNFVTLPDGTPVLAADAPAQRDGVLAPLQEAVEASVLRPYRAEAVRRGSDLWAVAASRIELVSAPELAGDEAELVSTGDGRSLHVDGQPRFGSVPAFERAGAATGPDYVVRGVRVQGDVWEIQVAAL
jgi:hypothetical protein